MRWHQCVTCRDALLDIGSAISSAWTLEQAEIWRNDALGLVQAAAKARRDHEGHQLTARWNARARRQRLVLERVDEALRVADKIAVQTRSIARALVDGAPAARPMPAVGAMLVSTASAIDAYTVWVASPGESADRQRLSLGFARRARRSARRWPGAWRWRDDPDSLADFRDHPGHEPADAGRGQRPARLVGRSGLSSPGRGTHGPRAHREVGRLGFGPEDRQIPELRSGALEGVKAPGRPM